MPKEPLLTRKALREHVVLQRNTQEQHEVELNESPIPKNCKGRNLSRYHPDSCIAGTRRS